MNQSAMLLFKGLAMGAANVIPGVSGGTIALITGIYEKFILSLKSFDAKAIQFLLKGNIRSLWSHVNGDFLLWIFLGIGVSLFSLAFLFKYLMENPLTEILLMAFFFGLIFWSVISVGKTISEWKPATIFALAVGLVIAVGIALVKPASENDATWYLLICGVIAMCSMILPGLSGSFVLIILGNYKLVMLDAVSSLNWGILIPVAIGAVVGLIVFSRLLAWVFSHYKDLTISLLTGFILGSLVIIWPWKHKLVLQDERLLEKGKEVIKGYEWYLPELSGQTWLAIGLIFLGALSIWAIERYAGEITHN